MDVKAIKKAKLRHETAAAAAANLNDASGFDEFSKQWSVFLLSAKGIYTALEQGAKVTARSRQWFGGRNDARRKDEMLRYVSEARNDDEHGIEEVTEPKPSELTVGANVAGASTILRDDRGNTYINCGGGAIGITGGHPGMRLPKLTALDGKPIAVRYEPAHIALKAVRDRSGRIYLPPASHLGAKLQSGRPREIADLTLVYLAGMISDAERLPTL